MEFASSRSWAERSPYERFFDFIKPDADRFGVLKEHIQKLKLNSIIVRDNGNRHFFIFPRKINVKTIPQGLPPFRGRKPTVMTAHYDRVAGSPGANDNSAAVFHLLKAALALSRQETDYWMIIFTDKEELIKGEGIQKQGSFNLAMKLKNWGLDTAQIFNFDACGTGDTLIFSSTTDYLLNKNQKPGLNHARELVTQLREKAFGTASQLRFSNVLFIPTPFSDDAGFLRGGIPAQTITMLPANEAAPYVSLLRNRPDFTDMVISGSILKSAFRELIPETWRCLNSPLDSPIRLTPEHYERVVKFAVELCKS